MGGKNTLASISFVIFFWYVKNVCFVCKNKGFVCVSIFFQVQSAWWVVRTVLRVMATPFINIHFRDLFMADQLLSVVIVASDLEYTICFFLYDAWSGTSKEK